MGPHRAVGLAAESAVLERTKEAAGIKPAQASLHRPEIPGENIGRAHDSFISIKIAWMASLECICGGVFFACILITLYLGWKKGRAVLIIL